MTCSRASVESSASSKRIVTARTISLLKPKMSVLGGYRVLPRLGGTILPYAIFSDVSRQFSRGAGDSGEKGRAWLSVSSLGARCHKWRPPSQVLLQVIEREILDLCFREVDLGNFRHVFADRISQDCGKIAGEGIALGQRLQVRARADGPDNRGVIDWTVSTAANPIQFDSCPIPIDDGF